LTLIALLTVLPFIHIVGSSFATGAEIADTKFLLFPTKFTLSAYKYIFSTNTILKSILVSITITVGGTLWSMLLSTLTAYGLSRKDLPGRRFILFYFVFTMLFSGGMILSVIVLLETGFLYSLLVLIVPVSINVFIMIILRTSFQNLLYGLEESAISDGANDFSSLFRIVIPLSMPAIATISFFYAVTYWSTY